MSDHFVKCQNKFYLVLTCVRTLFSPYFMHCWHMRASLVSTMLCMRLCCCLFYHFEVYVYDLFLGSKVECNIKLKSLEAEESSDTDSDDEVQSLDRVDEQIDKEVKSDMKSVELIGREMLNEQEQRKTEGQLGSVRKQMDENEEVKVVQVEQVDSLKQDKKQSDERKRKSKYS